MAVSNRKQNWIVHYYGFVKENGKWSGPFGYGPLFFTVEGAQGHKDAKRKFRAMVAKDSGKPVPKGAVIYTYPKACPDEKRKQVM